MEGRCCLREMQAETRLPTIPPFLLLSNPNIENICQNNPHSSKLSRTLANKNKFSLSLSLLSPLLPFFISLCFLSHTHNWEISYNLILRTIKCVFALTYIQCCVMCTSQGNTAEFCSQMILFYQIRSSLQWWSSRYPL
jgi:hypothetical protein